MAAVSRQAPPAAAVLILSLFAHGAARANIIHVTTTVQKVGPFGGCSLQEAIYAANLDASRAIVVVLDTFSGKSSAQLIDTECEAGSGDDTIVLAAGALYQMDKIVDDPFSPFGPTGTPVVVSNITIEGNGARLQRAASAPSFRAFAIGNTPFIDFGGLVTVEGHGNLTIHNAHVRGFVAKGGDAVCNGGGGLGAGGAIFVKDGILTVDNSTFEGNFAVGGEARVGGTECASLGSAGGGGGGMGGDGGAASITSLGTPSGAGGGGGGSRGPGASAAFDHGGSGGGTARGGGIIEGGFRCGGASGGRLEDGHEAACVGGGGGGGGQPEVIVGVVDGGDAGAGEYGGGGGGGGVSTTPTIGGRIHIGRDGAKGGFGGGGGGGGGGAVLLTNTGGEGGFGGGGGGCAEDSGDGGTFGGRGGKFTGGGGGALGGAIFSHAGRVTIRNCTISGNVAVRGEAVCPNCLPENRGQNGADAGAAIFAREGTLTVLNSTVSDNESTGPFGGIVFFNLVLQPGSFELRNTIVSHNGGSFSAHSECIVAGLNITLLGSGNLIMQNSTDAPCPGLVKSLDPLLGPLQLNTPGNTPTRAITGLSPAFNNADEATSLAFDQRGMARPQAGGFDIGAFEFQPPPVDFSVSAVGPLAVPIGGSASTTVTIQSINDFNSLVKFNITSSVPAGFSPSFTPDSVTPPPNGTASSTLRVSVSAALAAGSYSFNVRAIAGPPLFHDFTVVVNVGATSQSLNSVINSFRELGAIDSSGVASSLSAKVTSAQKLAASGQLQGAVNTLEALQFQILGLAGNHIATSATLDGVTFDPVAVLLADAADLQASVGSP